mmetsp:Transcript_13454/g.32129  ORF Transcript_13454/g.32129 Transcript_13454/m.32129 type:complete len:206 (+) Transcript_13454:325-942(+)
MCLTLMCGERLVLWLSPALVSSCKKTGTATRVSSSMTTSIGGLCGKPLPNWPENVRVGSCSCCLICQLRLPSRATRIGAVVRRPPSLHSSSGTWPSASSGRHRPPISRRVANMTTRARRRPPMVCTIESVGSRPSSGRRPTSTRPHPPMTWCRRLCVGCPRVWSPGAQSSLWTVRAEKAARARQTEGEERSPRRQSRRSKCDLGG